MILGISGLAGSGKSEVANTLIDKYNFVDVALADELKRTVMRWYGFTKEQLWGPSALRNTASPRYPKLICREVLQKLGTEVARAVFADTWVDQALSDTEKLLAGKVWGSGYYAPEIGFVPYLNGCSMRKPGGVVLTGVRFRNEFEGVRRAGGKNLRIKRAVAGLEGEAGQHTSETEQMTILDEEFDFILDNNGSLDGLAKGVDYMMREIS